MQKNHVGVSCFACTLPSLHPGFVVFSNAIDPCTFLKNALILACVHISVHHKDRCSLVYIASGHRMMTVNADGQIYGMHIEGLTV